MDDNLHMADVTLYVAIVTGGFTAVGAAIPQFSTSRQAQRAEHERSEAVRRDACLALVRSAIELRTQVANYHERGGSDVAPQLAAIRERAAAAEICAHTVAFMLPPLADFTMSIAAVAMRLAEEAERYPKRPPDFLDLNARILAFARKVAKADDAGLADGNPDTESLGSAID
jgi:hypothetical protein